MTYKVNHDRTAFEWPSGNVSVWVEQETVHMIAVKGHGPVELSQDMARELATVLLELADRLDY